MTDAGHGRKMQWSVAALFIAAGTGIIAYELLTRSRLEQTAALFLGLPALVAVIIGLAYTGGRRVRVSTPQAVLAWIIFLLGAGIVLFHALFLHHLGAVVLISVGVPAAAAILLIMVVQPQTATSSIMLSITILLLISGMFLGEGVICLIMAAPLFYGVGALIGIARDRDARKNQTRTMCILVLALLPMSSEGVNDRLSFPRDEIVIRESVVALTSDQVHQNLSLSPQVDLRLPAYLRMGFPHPVSASGRGLAPGSERRIHFAGGEGDPGDLVLVVAESRAGYVRFRALSDNSKIHHWLEWQSSEVEWHPLASGQTRVRWTLRYRRLLDPVWYFRPWERYAVGLAANYLIEANIAQGRAVR